MRMVQLTKQEKENILENLLKRSPNQYDEYQEAVNEILENVKIRITFCSLFLIFHRRLDIFCGLFHFFQIV